MVVAAASQPFITASIAVIVGTVTDLLLWERRIAATPSTLLADLFTGTAVRSTLASRTFLTVVAAFVDFSVAVLVVSVAADLWSRRRRAATLPLVVHAVFDSLSTFSRADSGLITAAAFAALIWGSITVLIKPIPANLEGHLSAAGTPDTSLTALSAAPASVLASLQCALLTLVTEALSVATAGPSTAVNVLLALEIRDRAVGHRLWWLNLTAPCLTDAVCWAVGVYATGDLIGRRCAAEESEEKEG